MTKFNPNIFSDPLGEGLKLAFGFPDCLVNLTKDVLSLLPGDVLGGIAKGISEGKTAAEDAMATVFEDIHDKLGILEFDSRTGKLSLLGNSSQAGVDGQSDSVLGKVGETLGFIAGAGMALWKAGQDVMDQIEAIENCLQEYEDFLNHEKKGETATQSLTGEFFVLKAQANAAQAYIIKANKVLADIASILEERSTNPDLIPVFAPLDTPPEEVNPIFRLTFGPPKAKNGQYLLSVDGIYYDSQTRTYADGSPVPTEHDLKFIPAKDRWKLDHSPNLGGRGTAYSIKELNQYVNTLFDLDKIDNGDSLTIYYKADHFLQVLETQRNQSVDNLQQNIVQLQVSGYNPNSALHINYTEQIRSQNAAYNRKINKRKKQIEAAVKAPDLFGAETVFSPGEVPVNDFSYLSSINLDVELERQKGLSFDHGEVSGIILPIVPIYVHTEGRADKVVLTPLEVPPTGVGSNLVLGTSANYDEVGPTTLSLTTNISVDGLDAIYNFADVNIQTPSSGVYNTLNCATLGTENRAQTVSDNVPLLYQQGLGLPYLAGIPRIYKLDAITEFGGGDWNTHPFNIAGVGNYVKLPDTSSYQNLLYSKEGATIDLWTYIPGLGSEQSTTSFPSHPHTTSAFDFELSSGEGKWCDSHYYRVLLGCENTGGENLNIDQSSVVIDRNSSNVRGMVMGFSRDPRMYYEEGIVQPGSNDFVPRENYGGYIDSVSSLPGVAELNNITGTWTLSSLPGSPLPSAARQASGTYKTNANPVKGSVQFTITDPGDKYTSSSNDLCCVLYATGSKGGVPYGPSALSSIISVAPFNGNLTMGATSSVFFIAPTQSYNTSAVGFVKNTGCATDNVDILKFVVSTEKVVGVTRFSDITSKFINIQIVFDTPNNAIKFYINGVLFKEQAISEVFGVRAGNAPQVPSFMVPWYDYTGFTVDTSSFYYSKNNVNQAAGVTLFDEGPNTHPKFTPWIVGGGWTDGRPVDLNTSSGGFLDAGAGIISSYNGYLGNLKIYNKALDTIELIKNYRAQKEFFENIDL